MSEPTTQPLPNTYRLELPSNGETARLVPEPEPPAHATPAPRGRSVLALLAITTLGLAARLSIIVNPALGHESDLGFFLSWTRALAEHGIGGFFDAVRFCDYPPLSILSFYAIATLAGWIEGGLSNVALLQALVKTPACLADLGISLLLFFEVRRLVGRREALAAAALYFLNPVAIYNSAYWGQVDSVYTALLLAAFVLVGRRQWMAVGALAAAALLTKFQAIALLPLLIMETYWLGGWRALGYKLVAALALTALVLVPFIVTGTSDDVLHRSYVRVIGQYNELTKGAYNLWYLVGAPQVSDTSVPPLVAQALAQGRVEVPADESWLATLSWRRISLVLYTLVVAVILTVYSWRPGPRARYGAAALLAFAFFLFPTEMHERYAFPAIAFMVVWAVAEPWRERTYFLLTGLLLLNLAAILAADPLAPQISAGNLLVFVGLLAALAWSGGRAAAPDQPVVFDERRGAPRRLVPAFRVATGIAVCAVTLVAGWIAWRAFAAPPLGRTPGVYYLSTLQPRAVQQGWGRLRNDHSVSGGMLQLGNSLYLRGLGTHTNSRLVYAVPEHSERFRAVVGINAGTHGTGSAVVSVVVDGRTVYTSPKLTGGGAPAEVEVAVAGARELVLRADATPDGPRADHVDWALARFE